jgi:uncharacterized protein (TIGR00730 family)
VSSRTRRQTARQSSKIDPELETRLEEIVSELPPAEARIALETISTAIKLAGDDFPRLDRKIVNSTLKELRFAVRVFAPYRGIRKASIFGSARTSRDLPEYEAAREFATAIAEKGWMVITGAGPGIMEAGHEGAGGEKSFGANIRLPMEGKPNQVIAEDQKLINFKYFFTRKLTFIREADAFALFPGGFGTLDEAFELLTLTQTGKTELHPIVMLDRPNGTFWQSFDTYIRKELLERGLISEVDLSLYRIVDNTKDAVEEIERFYRVYHSQRIVDGRVIFRLNMALTDAQLRELSEEFADSFGGPIERAETTKIEIRDDDSPELPRIALDFNWEAAGILRQFIDRLNKLAPG